MDFHWLHIWEPLQQKMEGTWTVSLMCSLHSSLSSHDKIFIMCQGVIVSELQTPTVSKAATNMNFICLLLSCKCCCFEESTALSVPAQQLTPRSQLPRNKFLVFRNIIKHRHYAAWTLVPFSTERFFFLFLQSGSKSSLFMNGWDVVVRPISGVYSGSVPS